MGKTFSREKKNHPNSFQNITELLFLNVKREIWDKGEMQNELGGGGESDCKLNKKPIKFSVTVYQYEK